MGADAFAPWHIIILVVVLVLLFGAKRLPGAAKSLGQSMHIFKQSVSGLHDDENSAANPAGTQFSSTPFSSPAQPAAPIAPPVQDATAQQLADLQRQVADLQRSNGSGSSVSEAQSTQPF
jgi:sec-independent protein translocase protein TatA